MPISLICAILVLFFIIICLFWLLGGIKLLEYIFDDDGKEIDCFAEKHPFKTFLIVGPIGCLVVLFEENSIKEKIKNWLLK